MLTHPPFEPLEPRALFSVAPTASLSLNLDLAGRYSTGTAGAGASEATAFDAASKRLLSVNTATGAIDILDLTTPATPTKIGQVSVTAYGAAPTAVASMGGVIAVAVRATTATDPGKVIFVDATGALLGSVTVGAAPTGLAFSTDGQKLVVANSGKANDAYTIDPDGSVSIISLAAGAAHVAQADVKTAVFGKFNSQSRTLRAAGVHLSTRKISVAKDLEPQSVTVSDDGKTAYVTLQENNAIAQVDLGTAKVRKVTSLGLKNYSATPSTQAIPFKSMPALGKTLAKQKISLGGFSGLFYEGLDTQTGKLIFVATTNAGPTATTADTNTDGAVETPFALPAYQPEIVRFEVNTDMKGKIKILSRIALTNTDGAKLTGLPGRTGTAGLANVDTPAVDLHGNALPLDPNGVDIQGITRSADGSFWVADAYRPSLLHFGTDGRLIGRVVPVGSNGSATTGAEALPAVLGQRQAGEGFSAVAFQNGKVYAFLQAPLDNPDTAADTGANASQTIRVVEYDPDNGVTSGQFVYRLDSATAQITDAVAIGNGQFLVTERDGASSTGSKKVFQISLASATNANALPIASATTGATLETLDAAGLTTAGVTPVSKSLYVDLAAAGYSRFSQPDGLALVSADTIAVLNDNGFNLTGVFDKRTGKVKFKHPAEASTLGLIKVPDNQLDPTDDNAVGIVSAPVKGMYQPNGIASFQVNGQTFLVTANQGEARQSTGYNEVSKVSDLTLDPKVFANASTIQASGALGNLQVSNVGDDANHDGKADQLLTFGGRSFSILKADGSRVYDSGDDLEQITAAALPNSFNSTSTDNNSMDDQSLSTGPEPRQAVVGVVGSHTYAFVSLGQIGGIVVYDVSNPGAPSFVRYINTRIFAGSPTAGTAGDLGTTGLTFIPATQSPSAQPLLVTSNASSGTVAVFNISQPS